MFHDSVEQFKAAGKSKMLIWCLKENYEARKFYEKMGGLEYKNGTHKWGNRDYDMISYTYNFLQKKHSGVEHIVTDERVL